ncbi:MAG: hypothetical protein R2709_03905 [Marmoricola sp.]
MCPPSDHPGGGGDRPDPRGHPCDCRGGRGAWAAQYPVRPWLRRALCLEANPRASRTVPFVSKATATPLAKAAARLMLGESIAQLRSAGSYRLLETGARSLQASRSRSRKP